MEIWGRELMVDYLAGDKTIPKDPVWQKLVNMLLFFTTFISTLFTFTISLLNYLPSWLTPRSHSPFDQYYASLPPIGTFSPSALSKTCESKSSTSLSISFEVWRPSPTWKRKSPGPPDFHICVVDGRDPFPSLEQLEGLYNSVARKFALGGKKGARVVVVVVDCGVSNYLTLDEGLFDFGA